MKPAQCSSAMKSHRTAALKEWPECSSLCPLQHTAVSEPTAVSAWPVPCALTHPSPGIPARPRPGCPTSLQCPESQDLTQSRRDNTHGAQCPLVERVANARHPTENLQLPKRASKRRQHAPCASPPSGRHWSPWWHRGLSELSTFSTNFE